MHYDDDVDESYNQPQVSLTVIGDSARALARTTARRVSSTVQANMVQSAQERVQRRAAHRAMNTEISDQWEKVQIQWRRWWRTSGEHTCLLITILAGIATAGWLLLAFYTAERAPTAIDTIPATRVYLGGSTEGDMIWRTPCHPVSEREWRNGSAVLPNGNAYNLRSLAERMENMAARYSMPCIVPKVIGVNICMLSVPKGGGGGTHQGTPGWIHMLNPRLKPVEYFNQMHRCTEVAMYNHPEDPDASREHDRIAITFVRYHTLDGMQPAQQTFSHDARSHCVQHACHVLEGWLD